MSRELERMQKKTMEKVEAAQNIVQNRETTENHLTQVGNEYRRVTDISRNAPAVIENLDRQFKEKIKLSDSDIKFLFLCTALQCARQYLLTNDKLRISAIQGDNLMERTVGQLTPPSWQDVLFQSVPYDALDYASNNVRELLGNSELSGKTHRFRTLGHDPVLGWIFGTANIMTSSLTKTDFITTYQISDLKIAGYYPLGTPGMLQTALEFSHDDPKLLAAAAGRQAIHFGSDYFTKQGLPIPIVATVNNDLAKTMVTKGHIDMWSVTRGAAVAALINQLIAVIHRLFYDENRDGSETLYEVRTRKILTYSNAISVGSNVVVTAFTKDLQKLDVGGMIVLLHRFISDHKFIQEVKRDFLKNEVYNIVVGKPYDFMEG